jgi:hypothetical protein
MRFANLLMTWWIVGVAAAGQEYRVVSSSTDLCAAVWTVRPSTERRLITTNRDLHESRRLVFTDLR